MDDDTVGLCMFLWGRALGGVSSSTWCWSRDPKCTWSHSISACSWSQCFDARLFGDHLVEALVSQGKKERYQFNGLWLVTRCCGSVEGSSPELALKAPVWEANAWYTAVESTVWRALKAFARVMPLALTTLAEQFKPESKLWCDSSMCCWRELDLLISLASAIGAIVSGRWFRPMSLCCPFDTSGAQSWCRCKEASAPTHEVSIKSHAAHADTEFYNRNNVL